MCLFTGGLIECLDVCKCLFTGWVSVWMSGCASCLCSHGDRRRVCAPGRHRQELAQSFRRTSSLAAKLTCCKVRTVLRGVNKQGCCLLEPPLPSPCQTATRWSSTSSSAQTPLPLIPSSSPASLTNS